ncbi:hypothetical protein [Hydrogenimonas sp.]
MIGMLTAILNNTPNEQSPFGCANAEFASAAGSRTAAPCFAGTSAKGSNR